MRNKFITIFLLSLILFFVFPGQVPATESATPTPIDYRLPYPGILPDHPLYPLKRFRDWLLLSLNRSQLKKTELRLLFADKKISMAQFLLNKRKTDLAVSTVFESQNDILKAAENIPLLSKDNLLPAGFSDKIELAAKKHEEIIGKILVNISDIKQKESLQKALQLNHQAISQIESIKQ